MDSEDIRGTMLVDRVCRSCRTDATGVIIGSEITFFCCFGEPKGGEVLI